MKIPSEIVLLCRDVRVQSPNPYVVIDGKDHIDVGCIGTRGYWNKADKAYHVDPLLHPHFAWRNIWQQVGGQWSNSFAPREDAICADSLEEVAMDLQLNGVRDVFLIQKKVVELLETRMVKAVGYHAATFFFLPFKWLKEKCTRIC